MTIINTLPASIANGQPIDAVPVMANFNQIVSNVNSNAAALAGGNAFTGTQTIGGKTIANLQDLADTSNVANGDALIGVKSALSGAVARTQHDKNADRVSLLDLTGGGADDTARFQAAVDSHKSFFVPQGNYTISTVNVGVYGCDIEFHKEAVINITGNGFQRNLLQTPRATFIAANSLLDATNYYFTSRYTGGTFNVAAGATAIQDRVPFLVNTGASPSQVLLQAPLVVTDANIVLAAASSIGIAIQGGWGATVRGGTIEAAGIDAIAINIGASNASGDNSCHPQEILIDAVTFNSCRPFASATGGCTNSCEGVTIRSCYFNFVRLAEFNSVNGLKWVANNPFVTDVKSLDFVDCADVTLSDCYFESNHDPDNAAKPGIVNAQNVQDFKFLNNSVNVLATALVTARDGVLIKTNASNGMRGALVKGNRFQHAAFNVTLETNAIRFATAGGTGQIVDATVRDNCCDQWHNAVNFTDHITSLATGVFIDNITNNGGVRFLKGIARIAPTALRAPGIWEQFSTYMHGQSSGSGTAVPAASDFWPTVMRSAAPVVTVTNFVNAANAQSLVATWAAIGANTVHIVLNQTAASAANATVEGSATITVDGTAV